jgi:spore coat protein H
MIFAKIAIFDTTSQASRYHFHRDSQQRGTSSMSRNILALTLLGLAAHFVHAQEANAIFGMTKVHELHLDFTAKEWERMQKVSGGPGFFTPKKPVAKDGEEPYEWHKSPGFGIEFPWAHADLTANGKTIKNVGVRYKGNGSYLSSAESLKRNLKIEVDHYVKEQRVEGLRTITLNAGAVDPSRMREALAYSVFRSARVPAPRTAFARVTLSVPRKYDKEFLGLYTFVEHVDKVFLKEHFKDNTGLLMKPERLRGIDFLGDDWERYKNRFFPKRDPTAEESKRIIDFARLISKGDDAAFKKEIGDYLDIDNFLRFIAVNTMLPNTDNFLTTGHNYYIYLHPKTKQLAFMPWDLDISFAGFPVMGSVKEQTNWDLLKPAPSKTKLVDRLLAIPDVQNQYRKILREIAANAFTKEKLLAEIDAMDKVTKEPLELERKAKEARKEKTERPGGFIAGFFDPQPELRGFVERRAAAVAKQVEGLK